MGLKINPRVVSEILHGEAIVANLETGRYYSIERVGALIWACVMETMDADPIAKEVAEIFAIPLTVAERDVHAFIRELVQESLIHEEPAAVSEAARERTRKDVPAEREAYEKPFLTKFEDVQELLLLDPVHDVTEWPPKPQPDRS